MPRAARPQREVDLVKKNILDTALQLIVDEGFQNFSMRKLAARLGMTATTIYNYYANKDEINVMIRMRGFEMLYEQLVQASKRHTDPLLKLQAMMRAYFNFGIRYPHYYDIMLNMHTPKYLDYVGTPLEQLGRTEKESSLRNYHILFDVVLATLQKFGTDDRELARYKTTQIWCAAHGVVSIYNSRTFQEIDRKPEALAKRLTEDVVAAFMAYESAGKSSGNTKSTGHKQG